MDELQFRGPEPSHGHAQHGGQAWPDCYTQRVDVEDTAQNTGGTNVSPDQRLGDQETHEAVTEGEQRGGFELKTRREKMRGDA